jgi:hypothetical protein
MSAESVEPTLSKSGQIKETTGVKIRLLQVSQASRDEAERTLRRYVHRNHVNGKSTGQ